MVIPNISSSLFIKHSKITKLKVVSHVITNHEFSILPTYLDWLVSPYVVMKMRHGTMRIKWSQKPVQ